MGTTPQPPSKVDSMELAIGILIGLVVATVIASVRIKRIRTNAGQALAQATSEPRTIKKATPKPVDPRESDWRTFIKTYEFPAGVIERALARCPQGTNPDDLDRGLRQFFLACGSTSSLAAAMPSKTVDEAWHEFLTYTRDYADFSNRAFGKMLHHIPEVTMTEAELDTNHTLGMVTAWVAACDDEGIPVFGQTAPTLFAADTRAVKPSKLRKRTPALSPAYVGFCGTNPADAPTTDTCTASKGTVCMRHAYAPDWRTLGAIVEATAATSSSARRKKAYASTSSSDTSGYDSVMLASLIPVLMPPVEDTTPAHVPASQSSCGSAPSYVDTTPSYTPSYTSSCGSSSSSSSCGSSSSSSSSSCGGGGGCGGGS